MPGDPRTIVRSWLALFDGRWPSADELRAHLTEDARFVERPSLVNPAGGERDVAAMVRGLETGRALLAWQRFEVRDVLACGDTVVARMRWSGELADGGQVLRAWCVGHYRVVGDRIAHIEQHDCYETTPVPLKNE